MNSAPACRCVHHKVVPVLIVLLGLTFLLAHFAILGGDTVGWVWPTLVILIGLVKMKSGSCKCFEHGA